MNTAKLTITEEIKWQPLSFDFKATARLAQGTAAIVATLLALLDTIALIPQATNLTGLMIDFVSLWVSALILWYVSFQLIIHSLGFLLGAIKISDRGLNVGHFGHLIVWDKIEALAIEPQPLFSQVCRLKERALRLSIFERRKDKIAIHDLPSFFYSQAAFQSLIEGISERIAGTTPDTTNAFILANTTENSSERLRDLKNAYTGKARQRLFIIVVIAIGLIFVMGRKTTVNYLYNSGNHYYHQARYGKAKHYYQQALKVDPVYTFAWAALAATEYHLNDYPSAMDNWRRALLLKPDFVEPKVGLAHLLIKQNKLAEAQELLNRALRRDPRNSAALLNMADINLRSGNPKEALRMARFVLTFEPQNPLAIEILTKARQAREPSRANIRTNLKP